MRSDNSRARLIAILACSVVLGACPGRRTGVDAGAAAAGGHSGAAGATNGSGGSGGSGSNGGSSSGSGGSSTGGRGAGGSTGSGGAPSQGGGGTGGTTGAGGKGAGGLSGSAGGTSGASGSGRGVGGSSSGPACGSKTCPTGEYCCNASCGLCAPMGAACIQIACAPGPTGCTTDADCTLIDDYCGGCNCDALPKGSPQPVCSGTMVNCLVAPCQGKTAACVNSACAAK
jgi:hypothetical protein